MPFFAGCGTTLSTTSHGIGPRVRLDRRPRRLAPLDNFSYQFYESLGLLKRQWTIFRLPIHFRSSSTSPRFGGSSMRPQPLHAQIPRNTFDAMGVRLDGREPVWK